MINNKNIDASNKLKDKYNKTDTNAFYFIFSLILLNCNNNTKNVTQKACLTNLNHEAYTIY